MSVGMSEYPLALRTLHLWHRNWWQLDGLGQGDKGAFSVAMGTAEVKQEGIRQHHIVFC